MINATRYSPFIVRQDPSVVVPAKETDESRSVALHERHVLRQLAPAF